jgi:uncharacterized protein YkwD
MQSELSIINYSLLKVFTVSIFLLYYGFVHAQSVPKNTGSLVSQEEAQKALDFHNRIRKEVGSPPLKWSGDLAKFAQTWADQLAGNCKMKHRPSSGPWKQKYGENIFWGSADDYTVVDACQSWYEEIEFFKPGKLTEKVWSKAGHYTQMVWKETKHMGMGIAVCKNGGVIVVANYNPAGNYIGERPY